MAKQRNGYFFVVILKQLKQISVINGVCRMYIAHRWSWITVLCVMYSTVCFILHTVLLCLQSTVGIYEWNFYAIFILPFAMIVLHMNLFFCTATGIARSVCIIGLIVKMNGLLLLLSIWVNVISKAIYIWNAGKYHCLLFTNQFMVMINRVVEPVASCWYRIST